VGAGIYDREIKVALGGRLKGIKNVITLGVRPNLDDYAPHELELLRKAPKIYYPTLPFAHEFVLLGKDLFPSLSSYYYAGDKVRQTQLFTMMGLSHPKTRIYYPRHHTFILQDFSFPFIAKMPRSCDSGRGVYLVRNQEELRRYLLKTRIAYIQEYLPISRDIRVVVIQYRVILAYWRKAAEGEFRTNVALGGEIEFADVPPQAVELALEVARRCDFNDIGIDILIHKGQCYVLEANLNYGRHGFRQAGLEPKKIYAQLLEEGVI
jgi:ribosomal protein S6--L-glutamate ligase